MPQAGIWSFEKAETRNSPSPVAEEAGAKGCSRSRGKPRQWGPSGTDSICSGVKRNSSEPSSYLPLFLRLCQISSSSARKHPDSDCSEGSRLVRTRRGWFDPYYLFFPYGCISMHWSLHIFAEWKLSLSHVLCTSSVLVSLSEGAISSSFMSVENKSNWSVGTLRVSHWDTARAPVCRTDSLGEQPPVLSTRWN